MPRLRNRFTGSQVNVPDEKVAELQARGFDPVDEKSAAKAPAKKAASKSSSK